MTDEREELIPYPVYEEEERPSNILAIECGDVVRNDDGVRFRLPRGDIVRIEPFLWLGGLKVATNLILIETRDIRRILTLNDQPIANNLQLNDKTYKSIPPCRLIPENIIVEFPECFQFIRDGQWNREAVFVCSSSDSTSYAIVVAYLMTKYRRSFWEVMHEIDETKRYIFLDWVYIRQFRLFVQMNYTIDVNNQEFRLYLFTCFIRCIEPRVADDPNLYRLTSSEQFRGALRDYFSCLKRAKFYGRVKSGRKYLCCKCNNHLFNEIDVITTDSIETSREIKCNDIFITPKRWMQQFVDRKPVLNLYGSIVCTNCSEKLGDYNLSSNGFRCRCAIHCEFTHNPKDSEEVRENKYYCLFFQIDASKCKLEASNKCCFCCRC